MSYEYDQYLSMHKNNVEKGFNWYLENLPDLLTFEDKDISWQVIYGHDESKNNQDEYDAYDAYFYGGNKSYEVVQEFNKAWLLHIHRNPHHWQYWILISDDPEQGEITLDMPREYIIEMICDWWSFSWKSGNLYEIFDWYEKRRNHIKLSTNTFLTVNAIMIAMKDKLEELEGDSDAK